LNAALQAATQARDEDGMLALFGKAGDRSVQVTSPHGLLALHFPRVATYAFGDAASGAGARITPPAAIAQYINSVPRWHYDRAPLLALAWTRGLRPTGFCLKADAPKFGAKEHHALVDVATVTAHQRLRFLQACGHPYTCALSPKAWDTILGSQSG